LRLYRWRVLPHRRLETEKKRGGRPTSVTGFALANLGMIAASRRDNLEARNLLKSALDNLTVTTGPENPQLIPIYRAYASVLKAEQAYSEAEDVETRATRIQVRTALLAASAVH
jgi:hypothetical protein